MPFNLNKTTTLEDFLSYENLPQDLIDWLETMESPQEILDRLPELFKDIKGQAIKGEVREGAFLHGDVFIDEGAVIHAGAVLEGPVYIGKNVSVMPQACIRKYAYLADDCVVGHSADVKASLCLNGSKMQDGTFTGDSVIGQKARVGSGVILANRKFNQSTIKLSFGDSVEDSGRDFLGVFMGTQSRLGANVVTSPGTVIGEFTWVGSGAVLQGYYAKDQLITVKQDLDVRAKDRFELESGVGTYHQM